MELKVPFYEFLNMLLTGIVFVVGFAVICPEYLLMFLSSELAKSFSTKSEILIAACVFAITYEIGLLINRLTCFQYVAIIDLVASLLQVILQTWSLDDSCRFNKSTTERVN